MPGAAWLGYDREFRILRQSFKCLLWNAIDPQLYFQQNAKVSLFLAMRQPAERSSPDTTGRQLEDVQLRTGQESRFFSHGYCTHYNIHGSCRHIPCCAALAHRCSLCDGVHGTSQWTRTAPPPAAPPATPQNQQPDIVTLMSSSIQPHPSPPLPICDLCLVTPIYPLISFMSFKITLMLFAFFMGFCLASACHAMHFRGQIRSLTTLWLIFTPISWMIIL